MNGRGIIFSGSSIQKILTGRKSQTRRVLFPQPKTPCDGRWYRPEAARPREWVFSRQVDNWVHTGVKAAFYEGQTLWVRENWVFINASNEPSRGPEICIGYSADGDLLPNRPIIKVDMADYEKSDKWWSSRKRRAIHMPRWASRMTIRITEVRIQRLHEIDHADALAEGAASVDAFRETWEAINQSKNGAAWRGNPWVIALSFERVQTI